MRIEGLLLSKHRVVLSSLAFAMLAGCTFQAVNSTPSNPTSASDSQTTPNTAPAPSAEASALSATLNATVDPTDDPLSALELPPSDNSENLEFVTVYMVGGGKLSFANFPRFGEGYLDKYGYVWSKNLRQTANGTYREAEEACAAVGGSLPHGDAWFVVVPTYSADGKTELIPGLSKTVIPMVSGAFDGRTGKILYSSTNSRDVLCVMKYEGRS